jgi:HSP20 family protein
LSEEMGHPKDLRTEIDELFADLWQVSRLGGRRRGFKPHVDSFQTEDPPEFTVLVELAGIDPAEVNVTASEGVLLISGVRRREPCESRPIYQQIEIEYGPFERVVQLPENADVSKAEARYEHGLLVIEMPITTKTKAPEPVPIAIRRDT